MTNVARWKSTIDKLMIKGPTGFKIRSAFTALLDFVHHEDWQGACHASSAVLYSLLAAQGIEAELYIGEISYGGVYFDHSWIEINGEIYDVAISKTLIADLYFPPVFRGVDLTTGLATTLQYGRPQARQYAEEARSIRQVSVAEYMGGFPDHPQGLFGMAKLVAKTAGIQVNLATIQKCAGNATWKERA